MRPSSPGGRDGASVVEADLGSHPSLAVGKAFPTSQPHLLGAAFTPYPGGFPRGTRYPSSASSFLTPSVREAQAPASRASAQLDSRPGLCPRWNPLVLPAQDSSALAGVELINTLSALE